VRHQVRRAELALAENLFDRDVRGKRGWAGEGQRRNSGRRRRRRAGITDRRSRDDTASG
jgi:hypothetical protein